MNTRQKIQKRVSEIYDEPTPNVYKGVDYNGHRQDYGWWYRPFNKNPIWLGKSLQAACETLDQMNSYRHDA